MALVRRAFVPKGKELVHADEHNGDPDEEVHRERVAKHGPAHDGSEDWGDGAAVLLEDGVSKLQEKEKT